MVNERSSNRFLFIGPAGNRFVRRGASKSFGSWELHVERKLDRAISVSTSDVGGRRGRGRMSRGQVVEGRYGLRDVATKHRVFISMLMCEIRPLEGIKLDRV